MVYILRKYIVGGESKKSVIDTLLYTSFSAEKNAIVDIIDDTVFHAYILNLYNTLAESYKYEYTVLLFDTCLDDKNKYNESIAIRMCPISVGYGYSASIEYRFIYHTLVVSV